MYPTVCALMDLWHVMTAAKIEVVEENPTELQAWIQQLTLDDMFDPAIWPQLRVFAEIKPDSDVLPVRSRYGSTRDFNIAVNRYSSDEPQWFALPDVLKSRLITARAPEIVRAIRLVPVGRQRSMRPITLRGGTEIDPYKDDLFRTLIEQRHRLPDKNSSTGRGLKTLANGTSYGIWAEMNRVEQPGGRELPVVVHGQRTFACQTAHPERPGPRYFPPIAALIASGARLMLGALEALVTPSGPRLLASGWTRPHPRLAPTGRQDREGEAHRIHHRTRPRQASRRRHPPPARPRGAARHVPRPAERIGPRNPGSARADAGNRLNAADADGRRSGTPTQPQARGPSAELARKPPELSDSVAT